MNPQIYYRWKTIEIGNCSHFEELSALWPNKIIVADEQRDNAVPAMIVMIEEIM